MQSAFSVPSILAVKRSGFVEDHQLKLGGWFWQSAKWLIAGGVCAVSALVGIVLEPTSKERSPEVAQNPSICDRHIADITARSRMASQKVSA